MENKWFTAIGVVLIVVITIGIIIRMPNLKKEEAEEIQTTATPTPTPTGAPEMILKDGVDYQAILHTSKGDVTIDLHEEDTPITVNNFVYLADLGFYTNIPFHRVMKDFMIQTGDPTGTGSGGPGYSFDDEEFTGLYTPGTIAMANAGPDTNGSQFFIMHGDYSGTEEGKLLPPNYTIFANVIYGMDVVDAIANVEVEASARGELSKPVDPVTLESVEILTKEK